MEKKTTKTKKTTQSKKKQRKPKYTPTTLKTKFDKYVAEEGTKETIIGIESRTDPETGEAEEVKLTKQIKILISVRGFCLYASVNEKYLYDLDREEYADVLEYINSRIEVHTLECLSVGDVPQTIGIFYLKNKCGYRDTKQVETTLDANINTNKLENISDEQLAAIISQDETDED